MSTSELDSRNIALSMRKSVENLVISSQDAIGQSISQALNFSGVIAHHTNQALQEARSVSRSPSPSLRSANENIDIIDSDKLEISSSGGDTISISELNLKDNLKSSAPTPPKSADGASRSKKKSWYSALYPTYKSRSEDFKRLFKDLPDDERLIVDYSCALQKDILVHGRLYASQNYLCFYANIFGWETSMSLRWKEVTAITKEKTALVIPNAILVCTEGEKNFLTSFSGRDKAYLMLFRVWQNALMDQPMTSHEIWQWVHSCYGEELGFNSDDDAYTRDVEDEKPPPAPTLGLEDAIDSSSMDASSAQESKEEIRPNRPNQQETAPPPVANGVRDADGGDTLPTDMTDTSDSEPDKPLNGGEAEKCTSPHDGKLLMHQQFSINIDHLFTMLFTNSKQYLELLAARNTRDYVQASWTSDAQTGQKCRQISYVLGLSSGPIGPKEVHVTETQVMNKCSKPGVLYSIDCTSENAGIPYADYFTVDAHYCLSRLTETATSFQIYGQVKYKKTVLSFIRGFLEKNAAGGLEEYVRLLEARLQREADAAPTKRKQRRRRRLSASPQEAVVSSVSSVAVSGVAVSGRGVRTNGGSRWLVWLLVLLLALNALLYWRLYVTQREPHALNIEDLQNKMSSLSGSQLAEWSALLERHSLRQRSRLAAWRAALAAAVDHLAQTEQALAKLIETIKPSLERAQQEATESPRSDL